MNTRRLLGIGQGAQRGGTSRGSGLLPSWLPKQGRSSSGGALEGDPHRAVEGLLEVGRADGAGSGRAATRKFLSAAGRQPQVLEGQASSYLHGAPEGFGEGEKDIGLLCVCRGEDCSSGSESPLLVALAQLVRTGLDSR